MMSMRITVIVAMLVASPSWGQELRGSLVVFVVSDRADYVVIGAESRTVDGDNKPVDDRACKIISLGGDTLFYETGNSELGDQHGKHWNSNGAARAVYATARNRDAQSLSLAWGNKALTWFYRASLDHDLGKVAEGKTGNLVSGGFINFDKNGSLSVHSAQISYDVAKRALNFEPTSQGPGQVGISGVGKDLVVEFNEGKTFRAATALGTVGVKQDAAHDIAFVQKAIKFAMDNAVGKDKTALGGDIDVAIIRSHRTIQWIARKPWCGEQDLKQAVR